MEKNIKDIQTNNFTKHNAVPFKLFRLKKEGIQVKYARNNVTESKSNMLGMNAPCGGIQPAWISLRNKLTAPEFYNVHSVYSLVGYLTWQGGHCNQV